jgi:hypothetical protein
MRNELAQEILCGKMLEEYLVRKDSGFHLCDAINAAIAIKDQPILHLLLLFNGKYLLLRGINY